MDARKFIRFCGLVLELHMHTNVYARGCSLSATCQVAMVKYNLRARLRAESIPPGPVYSLPP